MINCDCGLTAGCKKCRPIISYMSEYIGVDMATKEKDKTFITLEYHVAKLLYHRVMAVAKARADDAGLYGELVDAVHPLRSLVTNFGWGRKEEHKENQ